MSSCSCMKDSFASAHDAKKALASVRRRVKKRESRDAGGGSVSTLQPYRCPEGNGFHLGNRRRWTNR